MQRQALLIFQLLDWNFSKYAAGEPPTQFPKQRTMEFAFIPGKVLLPDN